MNRKIAVLGYYISGGFVWYIILVAILHSTVFIGRPGVCMLVALVPAGVLTWLAHLLQMKFDRWLKANIQIGETKKRKN